MEKSVPRLLGDEQLESDHGFHVFGIRHLSPAGAFHLRAFLDEVRPTAILVEGPSDANAYITQLTAPGVAPPIAILAYTSQLPVKTLLYPYADYSPEYQAFRWASENGAHAEFMDLPSEISLALYERKRVRADSVLEGEGNEEKGDRASYAEQQRAIYQRLVELSGEADYESYWERNYEHSTQKEIYRNAIHQYSAQMRELTQAAEWELTPTDAAYNEIREAYMRRTIQDTIRSGHHPQRVVVLTGAHHASALNLRLPIMTDAERKALPRIGTQLTLMPYSYYKLSSHSGYGAGNPAPAYFELLWQCFKQGDLRRLPALYLSHVSAHLRSTGTFRSTASVIEAVRMAEALASLRDATQPTWKDLRDAATVCLGYGELSVVAEALARTDIGTAIGSLPDGVSQTPIQDDLNRELRRLKLEKYKTSVAARLELDLRENRQVQSEASAFLDLNRSILLHRLQLLGISLAKKVALSQDSSSWAEHWVLQWSPEAEIQIVEAVLKGETIELATAYVLHERLVQCSDIAEASRLIRTACDCALDQLVEQARYVLQELAVDAGSFEKVAASAYELSVLIRYGSLRRMNTDTLVPLLQQLFLRGTLLVVDAAGCNDDAATAMVSAIQALHQVAMDHYDTVNEPLWLAKLKELASRDDRNARLSGFSFAILLERNEISDELCAREVSRRLSPGIPVDLGAGWFEGLSMRNRYALLSRASLWTQLDAYIHSLEQDAFLRSLVFLRRAFSTFEAKEKAAVAEMMGDLWGLGADQTGAVLQQPLSQDEKEQLNELNEFDFGDL